MTSAGPVLILTASAGAGHTMAARAVEGSLRALRTDLPIEVIDVLHYSNRFFRRLYAQGYLALVNHAPTAMGWLYEALDRPNQRARDSLRCAFQTANMRPALRLLRRRQPRLIINTHFLPAEMVAGLRRRRELTCPQVTVTTDFETHRLWVQPPTERYYTATADGKAYLQTWDVPERDILVTGIPVRAAFEQPVDRAVLRARLDLDPRRPVVLLLCGGFGVGPTEGLFRELLSLTGRAQIIAITGRNEKLRERLARAATGAAAPRVLGFTEQMHEWMHAADVVITKPGGLTVSEALTCGAALVVVNPIPGQEARNSDYLLENGAAIKVNNPRLLGHRVAAVLAEPARLEALRRAARAIHAPGAADRIARDALRLLEPAGAPGAAAALGESTAPAARSVAAPVA